MSKRPFELDSGNDRTLNEILLARRDAAPKEPLEAAASFIYALARELLRREVRPEREVQILHDFEKASHDLVTAAAAGATVEEQAQILGQYWEHFELPEADRRKRREPRGPTDGRLLKEVEALWAKLKPILRGRRDKIQQSIIAKLEPLARWATPKKLREAAASSPMTAACILIGARYHLSADTIRDRVSRARKQA